MSYDFLSEGRVVPPNFGPLHGSNANARITGPCGDTMEIWLRVENDRVAQARFTTDGCDYSIVCGALAAKLVEGKLMSDAAITRNDVLAAVGEIPEEYHHCALLASDTLKAAVSNYCTTRCASAKANECKVRPKAPRTAESKPRAEKPNTETDQQELRSQLGLIKHKILVLSGKGGVGKSTVAVNLAVSLMLAGKRVGLLDVDIHGPSVPKMLGLEGMPLHAEDGKMLPVEIGGLRVMSIGFLLRNQDDAVIWRGPMKMGVIKQFLKDVLWGELDYLIVDAPPGTGDEPLSVCQLMPGADGAIVVTTPQDVALAAVRKSITFCRQLNMPLLGVVENMSGFACPHCGTVTDLFTSGGGERMAREMGVPFLGRLPLDPFVGEACDAGKPYVSACPDSSAAEAFRCAFRPILELSAPQAGP
ncbi:MAG TPA: P-loop NTPase [Phycisphaerae bacterium]|nr:P-loop NTPase [Phycisphaerae bacterium]